MNISATNAAIPSTYGKLTPSESQGPNTSQPPLESDKSDSTLKSFGYGLVGMDKPEEVKQTDDTAYTAGQVLKAIGTVGSIIAIMV